MKFSRNIQFASFLTVFLIAIKSYSQETSPKDNSWNRAVNYIDRETERHKWEINLDMGRLFKLNSGNGFAYPYLIKRNVGKEKRKYGAIRFMATPYTINLRQKPPYADTLGANSFSEANNVKFEPITIVGYEWQKVSGRFVFFYGLDAGWRMELNRGRQLDYLFSGSGSGSVKVRGTLETKTRKNVVWLAPLMGGKFYMSHRFSVSLESQVQFVYAKETSTNSFNGREYFKNTVTWREIDPYPLFLVNLSYNL